MSYFVSDPVKFKKEECFIIRILTIESKHDIYVGDLNLAIDIYHDIKDIIGGPIKMNHISKINHITQGKINHPNQILEIIGVFNRVRFVGDCVSATSINEIVI